MSRIRTTLLKYKIEMEQNRQLDRAVSLPRFALVVRVIWLIVSWDADDNDADAHRSGRRLFFASLLFRRQRSFLKMLFLSFFKIKKTLLPSDTMREFFTQRKHNVS